jgi:hypothetical protein
MNDESLENERQKNASLKIRRVRDKIDAVTRKHDHLSKQISRLPENSVNTMRHQLLEKLHVHETDLEELELQLNALLDAKSKRREKVLSNREAAHGSSQLEHKQMTTQDDCSGPRSSSLSSVKEVFIRAPATDDGCTASGEVHMIAAAIGPVCCECSIMPTKYKCRKCKERYVCDICCSTK